MDTPVVPPLPGKPRRRVWRWIGLGLLAATVLAVAGVASLVWLDRDARILREQLLTGLHSSPKTRVQLNLGWGSLSLARLVVRLVPDVPEEARTALSAVRAVSVGVYQLAEATSPDPATMTALDKKMAGRGWTRTVFVRSPKETVVVYTTTGGDASSGSIRVCVAVVQARELVVVSARGETGPLVALAQHHLASKPLRVAWD